MRAVPGIEQKAASKDDPATLGMCRGRLEEEPRKARKARKGEKRRMGSAVVGRDERPRSSAMRLDGGWGMVVEDG